MPKSKEERTTAYKLYYYENRDDILDRSKINRERRAKLVDSVIEAEKRRVRREKAVANQKKEKLADLAVRFPLWKSFISALDVKDASPTQMIFLISTIENGATVVAPAVVAPDPDATT